LSGINVDNDVIRRGETMGEEGGMTKGGEENRENHKVQKKKMIK